MTASITFSLPPMPIKGHRWYPSLNARPHWALRAKISKAWKTAAWAKCVQHVRVKPWAMRARITFTCHNVRDVDRDNLHARVKPLLDGIVLAGVVPDDSAAYVDLVVTLVRVAHFADERIDVEIVAV